MACTKLGSKSDAFQRQGQAWFCTTGLPSDIVVEVGEMTFHLHKFPLLSRSGVMERLIAEALEEGDEKCVINLHDNPGGAKTFELVAKFCYGVKLELTSSNVVYLRCAAEHLEMTEDYGEGNLIMQTETFFNQVVLGNWNDSLKALQTCDHSLPYAEELHITKRCIESLATKAYTDPNLFGWPIMEHGPMQSPGGSVLWNGISTGARPKKSSSDWWYEDVLTLSLPFYKRLISIMESRGVRQEIIAGSLAFYAKKYLPGLNRRQGASESSSRLMAVGLAPPSEEDQKALLEDIDSGASPCSVDDSHLIGSPSLTPITLVAKLIDGYMAEVAPDVNLKLPKFQALAAAVPEYARPLDDGLYRAIDVYLKSHPWLAESEREQLCRLMDCQKLSLEASKDIYCRLLSGFRQPRWVKTTEKWLCWVYRGGWATAVRENLVLKVGMDNMRMRVSELEMECSIMRQEIEKMGRTKGSSTWGNVSKKFGFKLKSQLCSAQEALLATRIMAMRSRRWQKKGMESTRKTSLLMGSAKRSPTKHMRAKTVVAKESLQANTSCQDGELWPDSLASHLCLMD
ncbi:hypothetical protein GH714_017310 [Hevea brasiliensis]|uniref:NPH3 domain-containing protein n=1 Tax=Hevea brasiliensis TaxID=3981 RepID=A0A6A6MEY0_HEVBR|nr:hypothetical protein GH714_017310 [Hevea brasiliensis]